MSKQFASPKIRMSIEEEVLQIEIENFIVVQHALFDEEEDRPFYRFYEDRFVHGDRSGYSPYECNFSKEEWIQANNWIIDNNVPQ